MTHSTTCRECIDAMMDYVDGRLSAADRADFDAHLAMCPPCVDFLRSYRETPEILRRATAVDMPMEMTAMLRRFLDEKKRDG